MHGVCVWLSPELIHSLIVNHNKRRKKIDKCRTQKINYFVSLKKHAQHSSIVKDMGSSQNTSNFIITERTN